MDGAAVMTWAVLVAGGRTPPVHLTPEEVCAQPPPREPVSDVEFIVVLCGINTGEISRSVAVPDFAVLADPTDPTRQRIAITLDGFKRPLAPGESYGTWARGWCLDGHEVTSPDLGVHLSVVEPLSTEQISCIRRAWSVDAAPNRSTTWVETCLWGWLEPDFVVAWESSP